MSTQLPNRNQYGYYTLIAERCAELNRPYDRRHISNVLNGKVGYSSKSLPIIARACGVSEQQLINYIEYARTNTNG